MSKESEVEKTSARESAKTLTQLVIDVVKWTGSEIKDVILLERASSEYLRRYVERHGRVKVLGMPQPIPLRRIYTSVQFADPADLGLSETFEALEAAFRRRSDAEPMTARSKSDAIAVANVEKFLNVLGPPGAGKSTFMRRIGLDALVGRSAPEDGGRLATARYNFRSIPVFLELKTLDVPDVKIDELIEDEFLTCGFPPGFAKAALKRGDLLVLLDGLDEVPADKLQLSLRHIQDFVDRYSDNRFITSCRTAFYKNWLTRFRDVKITRFDNQQIETFIENWFQAPIDLQFSTAAKCWHLLSSRDHAATLELARSPLLLTFLCLVYNRTQGFPSNRSSLYRRALTILLEEWAAEKRLSRPTIYEGLHTDLELLLLAHIAGPSFIENKLLFREEELVSKIAAFLREELSAPKTIDARGVLHAVEAEQGLLVQRARGVYSFSHLTLHEFLAALYISSESRDLDLTERALTEPSWREVALLLAGLGKADNLLQQMAEEIWRIAQRSQVVAKLVAWCGEVASPAEDDFQYAANRALGLYFRIAFELEAREVEEFEDTQEHVDLLRSAASSLRSFALQFQPSFEAVLVATSTLARRLQPLSSVALALGGPLDMRISINHLVKTCNVLIAANVFREEVSKGIGDIADALNIDDETSYYGRLDFEIARMRVLDVFKINQGREVSLRLDDIQVLETITNASHLVVECRRAALSVSAKGWQRVVGLLVTAL